MESKFICKQLIRKRSYKEVNSIKSVSSLSTFRNESNGSIFRFTDVQLLRHKRNKKINKFFDAYIDLKKYDLVEFGIPYSTTEKIERITQKIKRRCSSNGCYVFALLWIFDVGEENFGAHYHLVVAIDKYKKNNYPEFLKITFKNQAIHGSFVRNRLAFRRYLLGKEIYERGKRKRVFGNSRCFKLS